MLDPHSPPRRLTSRVAAPVGSWACWASDHHDRISRVINLSLGGLLLEASSAIPVGETVFVSLHTQVGEIAGDATARHIGPVNLLGLQFTKMSDENRLRLAAVMARARFPRLCHEQTLLDAPCNAASCASESLRKFGAEVAIHIPGLANISKRHIWVFPQLVVCMHCGKTLFAVPEDELHRLAELCVK